jgi:WD40 repeat protein
MEKNLIIRSVIQFLENKGYSDVAKKLEEESQISLESQEMKTLKNYVYNENYEEAIKLILKACKEGEYILIIPKIRGLQFYELLLSESGKNSKLALEFLRRVFKAGKFYEKDSTLEKCASLVFIKNKNDLYKKMKELSPSCTSKESLLEYINTTLYKSRSLLKSLYPHNLEQMINSVTNKQINNCIYHNVNLKSVSYFETHSCDQNLLPNKCLISLDNNNEEVVNLTLSNTFNYFAAIFKSNSIVIFFIQKSGRDSINLAKLCSFTAHKNQITSAVFNKMDSNLLTASKDKTVKLWDVNTGQLIKQIEIEAMVSSAIFSQDDNSLILSTLDQKLLIYDKQGRHKSTVDYFVVSEMLYSNKYNIYVLSVPTSKAIFLYNLEEKTEVDEIRVNDTIVSICLSKLDKGGYLLINSSTATPVISMWDLTSTKLVRKYFGHRQEGIGNRCAFGGFNENFIICGSITKEIYIWNRLQSVAVSVIKAHSASVNAIIWPSNDYLSILISCSDDHYIKVFANSGINKVTTSESANINNLNNLDGNEPDSSSEMDDSEPVIY